MQYVSHYQSPLGDILLAADDIGLIGLWFEGQRHFGVYLDKAHEEKELSLFQTVKHWLNIYFSGNEPDLSIPLHFMGTKFQNQIWQMLCSIPYGQLTTYGEMACKYATASGLPHMSAHTVGNAVGRNPLAIIVPCHRVVGARGKLTGYAAGIDRKMSLLHLEKADRLLSDGR